MNPKMLDSLAAMLTDQHTVNSRADWLDLFTLIRRHLETDQWVWLFSAEGKLDGWAGWLRTDELGAALLREYDLDNLIRLAIPLKQDGPVLVLAYCVIMPMATENTALRLWAEVARLNYDATQFQTRRYRAGRSYWVTRKLVRKLCQ